MSTREAEWFRNKEWSPSIEQAFRTKLRRARDKQQYLRIQASYLVDRYPETALQLTEEYFALGENFDVATAYWTEAKAHTALGDFDQALSAFNKCFARERSYPNLKTSAWSDYLMLVTSRHMKHHYLEAAKVLTEHSVDDSTFFPRDKFCWYSSLALIQNEEDPSAAKESAKKALEWSAVKQSGFRHHQNLGLVGNEFTDIKAQLRQILESA